VADEPRITEPPANVRAEISALRAALAERIPPRMVDRNLLIATWNLREFGGLTKAWESGPRDVPKRNLRDVALIAEVVRQFDLIAIQEVQGDLRALRHMMKALGPNWGFLLTDTGVGDFSGNERLAFVFDTQRVKLSGLAGEVVIPVEQLAAATQGQISRQFARPPYAVSFLAGDTTFVLITLHILWGKAPADRVPELKAIADWLAGWAARESEWGHNLICLGDFNIDRRGDALYDAFASSGLAPPPALNDVPRTIFDSSAKPHFYDQIAWFHDGAPARPVLELIPREAGSFDFLPLTLGKAGATTKVQLSFRISDHYPLWAKFGIPPG
jgi:endonuclease/exonuclease/phosphatase family metal-dependent hydrolase